MKEKIRLLKAANKKINTSPYKTDMAKLFDSIFPLLLYLLRQNSKNCCSNKQLFP